MKQQQGVVLLISLIILVMMTLLGLSSMNGAKLDEKMASNSNDMERAFQAAEIGLREAEAWLLTQVTEPIPTSTGANGIWALDVMDPDKTNTTNWWQEVDQTWWMTNGKQQKSISGVNTAPQTIIEFKQYSGNALIVGSGITPVSNSRITYYRITSRGTGATDAAVVLLQSTFSRSY